MTRRRDRNVGGLILLLLAMGRGVDAQEPGLVDVELLNQYIGVDYVQTVELRHVIEHATRSRLLIYGAAHDQAEAVRHFLAVVDSLLVRWRAPVVLGIEFVDRGDADILRAYLKSRLSEAGFRDRVMPTSLLHSVQAGPAHMEVLRHARRHGLEVLPLESRPSGARPRELRNSEMRWNLATQLGRHPNACVAVFYGVDHVLGGDPITAGIEHPMTIVTAYGDSVEAAYLRRERRALQSGECLELAEGIYLQAAGLQPTEPRLLRFDVGAKESTLEAIEAVYAGSRRDLSLLVEALLDAQVGWRRAAIHALEFAAGERFAYDPEAPEPARRRAQERWLQWWKGYTTAIGAEPDSNAARISSDVEPRRR